LYWGTALGVVYCQLLTGFDAPILQAMYLDKGMRDHTLLQAVARANRPYTELKEYGPFSTISGYSSQIEALRNYLWEEVKPQVDEVVFPKLQSGRGVEARRSPQNFLLSLRRGEPAWRGGDRRAADPVVPRRDRTRIRQARRDLGGRC
jgi:hypothetical protein